MSYGPLMRFVAGADYAARHLTQHVAAKRAVSSEGEHNCHAASVGTGELYVGRGN